MFFFFFLLFFSSFLAERELTLSVVFLSQSLRALQRWVLPGLAGGQNRGVTAETGLLGRDT